ncbi:MULTISPECIES: succinyl-diaminopimelate desuccinylase [unclassified Beijerinckia]|uniref:succinyl-diaminopimelate desuccinylase n=1 Tax=unclassified Beijerinckia TaxID=2638183 RepID=UPI000899FF16|nr:MULTISPECIES: succinyl-diaminopimelate desuccinylase [unclassified Beijerinckia]MDH7796778.1 succinyl-diaminopimelate desuccinylase [Beijerinckia sp. GAS462]SEC59426.1 succinyldiaminopimelate desuccinylase [Beijerinckia sp. 28-YEA-48]
MTSAVTLLRDLIRCPSVTPQDAGALGLIENVLKGAGFETHRIVFSEPGYPDTDNLYARIGSGAPSLVFAGHTDVVPTGDAAKWRFDPFSAEVADGMIWGRGAVDMKGGIAASIAATLNHLAAHGTPKGSIAFLITGDEEGPAVNGTVKLLQWAHERGERFDHCILGEPTNPDALGDMIKIGRRGSLSGTLVVHGRQGHVGYPHLADNPVHHILRIGAALRAEPLDQGTPHFDASNLEITAIDTGNPAVNVIPDEARAAFNIRFNDLWQPDTLAAEVRRRVEAAAQGARYTLDFKPTNALAFVMQPGPFVEAMSQAIAAETGRRPVLSTTGGTSDARFICNYAQVVEFGLVGQTMHAIDERTAVADVEKLEAIYTRVLANYFA